MFFQPLQENKKSNRTIDRSLFYMVCLLPINCRCTTSRHEDYSHSIPFQIPESNSLVDINDGNKKGERSHAVMHHQSQPLFGFSNIALVYYPILPGSRTGFLKMSKILFFKAASISTCLLLGLCSCDSYILTVMSPGAFQLCSVQRCLLTSFWAHSTMFTLLLRGLGYKRSLPEWQTSSNTLADRLWLNIPGLLNSLAPLFGVHPTLTMKCSVLGKNSLHSQSRLSRCSLTLRLETTLCLILHWSSKFERLLQKHKRFQMLTPAICNRKILGMHSSWERKEAELGETGY